MKLAMEEKIRMLSLLIRVMQDEAYKEEENYY